MRLNRLAHNIEIENENEKRQEQAKPCITLRNLPIAGADNSATVHAIVETSIVDIFSGG